MKTYLLLLSLTFTLLAVPAFAEQKPAASQPTLETSAAKVIDKTKSASPTDDASFFTLNLENDLFGGGSDRNYTNGIRVTYYDMGADKPRFVEALDRVIPTFSINDTTSIYYSAGQNMFTPKDITIAAPQPGERPWAGFLYGSVGLSTITDNHIDNVEATLGIVGPWSLAEPAQEFIHKNISDSPRPQGWDNQLHNEPGLMLSWERSFPGRYSVETMGWTAAAVPHVGATVGNIYTYANTGISFRLSPYAGRWQDDPVRVRPAMPGTGAFIVPENTFSWYLFGGVDGRAVAQNIFLDGNTFEDSASVDKKNFVADVNAGIALTYGRTRLSYTMVYRTKEFDTAPDDGDVFGSISLGYRF